MLSDSDERALRECDARYRSAVSDLESIRAERRALASRAVSNGATLKAVADVLDVSPRQVAKLIGRLRNN